jgi:hypothetical protein
MMLLRVVLLFILFMLITKLARTLFNFIKLPQSKTKERSQPKFRDINSDKIEDIDYKEVKRKDG